MKLRLLAVLGIWCFGVSAQPASEELTFNEFLGYVKKFHPMVRQANLEVSKAQAALMVARGGFDPKIEVDFDRKQFKGTEYYSQLNSAFKIPTWYGIEIKAGFDNAAGQYVNPQNKTPVNGLASIGINVPLAQGLLINQRMLDVRNARIQLRLSDAERKMQATAVLYDAAMAYFNWKKTYDEMQLYSRYLNYASKRYTGVIGLIKGGDKPAIDSVEAGITVKNRLLSLEDAKLKFAKAKLDLSNYLWIENTPVELSDSLVPQATLERTVAEDLNIDEMLTNRPNIESHPKIQSLEGKIDMLDMERRYKANLLLPKINVGYNYISEPRSFEHYRFEDYKLNLSFAYPLFLRKERGGVKLAKLKIQDTKLDLDLQRVQLGNKITAQQTEIRSVAGQKKIIEDLVTDYTRMLDSEDRLFSFGESSIFLINSRENSLVSTRLSSIAMTNRYLNSFAELFKILSNPD